MDKKTIKDINLAGKTVLVRTDYNVTLEKGSKIADDTRVSQSLPTLNYLLKKNCRLILMSHLGRPEGKKDLRFSLRPVAKDLEKLLGKKVCFVQDYLSADGQKKIRQSKNQINLLENLRFHPEEEKNDPVFSRQLANLAEVYVNDAFGTSHRRHASIVGVPRYLPAVAGLLLGKEVDIISRTLSKPSHPFTAIVGGAKTETKIALLGRLMEKADIILLGGCVAITFLKAKGFDIGRSKYDKKAVGLAKKLLLQAKEKKVKFYLPLDNVLGDLETNFVDGTVPVGQASGKLQILDIGPETEAFYGSIIDKARTIIWNGPMGMIEKKQYRRGTDFIFYAVSQNKKAVSIVGGGDTIAAISKKEYLQGITHLSTGGGAMLEFIEKGTLLGIQVLQKK